MQQRTIGNSGLKVSTIGLGCNNFGMRLGLDDSARIIHRALDLGINLFDTAPIYGNPWGESERVLKCALADRRQEAVIVSKFGMSPDFSLGPDTSRSKILRDIDESLERLGTDYLDLYLLHWRDSHTPMEETLRALDDIVKAGKARYVGCCNLPAWQVVEAKWISRTEGLHPFIVSQDEYSLVMRKAENSLIPALESYGMGLMPYAPLANGLLSGRFSSRGAIPKDSRLGKNVWNMGDKYLTPENLNLVDELRAFAEAQGHTLLELAISWLLSNKRVCSVIAGASSLEHIEANAAAGQWHLSAKDLEQIDQICQRS